jgi:hypothetical protein
MWGRNTGNESRHPGYFASSISSFTPQHYSHRSTANASLLDEHEAIILETEKKDEATDVVQEVYDPESGPMNRPSTYSCFTSPSSHGRNLLLSKIFFQ